MGIFLAIAACYIIGFIITAVLTWRMSTPDLRYGSAIDVGMEVIMCGAMAFFLGLIWPLVAIVGVLMTAVAWVIGSIIKVFS